MHRVYCDCIGCFSIQLALETAQQCIQERLKEQSIFGNVQLKGMDEKNPSIFTSPPIFQAGWKHLFLILLNSKLGLWHSAAWLIAFHFQWCLLLGTLQRNGEWEGAHTCMILPKSVMVTMAEEDSTLLSCPTWVMGWWWLHGCKNSHMPFSHSCFASSQVMLDHVWKKPLWCNAIWGWRGNHPQDDTDVYIRHRPKNELQAPSSIVSRRLFPVREGNDPAMMTFKDHAELVQWEWQMRFS